MKIISPTAHGILDYATVIFLLASPPIFGMEGNLCTITYSLAAVHFGLTMLTDFKPGIIKIIPFRIHGLIEISVALSSAALAFWFYGNDNTLGFYFYMTLAVVIMIVFILTDFNSTQRFKEA